MLDGCGLGGCQVREHKLGRDRFGDEPLADLGSLLCVGVPKKLGEDPDGRQRGTKVMCDGCHERHPFAIGDGQLLDARFELVSEFSGFGDVDGLHD